ncbi:MAG: polysaccharide biosynthesis C-terminal domain-containing protein [Candidatus Cloacimonetes bacterium]|nr:polysaccharide biosynthesis C-terminal domain-containing protein [Candidatus Cloacimonadota bacterium]
MKTYGKISTLSLFKILTNVTVLAITVILSRNIEPGVYGLFRKLLVYFLFFSKLMTLGFPNSILKYSKNNDIPYNKDLISRSIISISPVLVGILIISICVLVFIGKLSYLGLLVVFILLVYLNMAESSFMVVNHPILSGLFSFFLKGGLFLVPGLLLLATNNTVLTFNLSIIYLSIVLICFLIIVGFQIKKSYNLDISLKKHFRFSATVWFASLAGAVFLQSDKIIVSLLKDNATFAIFSNGAFEIPVIGIINGAIFISITPTLSQYFAEGKLDKTAQLWKRVSQKCMLILLPVFSFFVFRSKDVMVLLFSEYYIKSTGIFLLYLFFIPLRVYIFSGILMATDEQGYYFKIGMIAAIINVILTYILVRFISIYFAPITTLTVTVFMDILYFRKVGKVCNKKIREIFIYKEIVVVLLISLILSFAIQKFIFIDNEYMNIVVNFVVFSLLIIMSYIALKYVSIKKICKRI